ncbi:superoxide dismutase, partial [Pseudomonas sp. FW305-3-2-15-A-R2A1]
MKTTGKAGIALGLASTVLPSFAKNFSFEPQIIPYTQQPLGYGYKDLEIAIDAMTMEIHYTKHAATYAKNLNEAVVAEKVDIRSVSLEN